MKGVNDSPHPIRVLVVDDSAFTRMALTRMIESDPALCVTETAQNGREALEKIASLHPDVVTLDIEMPGMNGLETLKRIMREFPCKAPRPRWRHWHGEHLITSRSNCLARRSTS